MSFISRGSARFNWHSCTVASLKVPAMIVYDMVMNVLDTKWFPQHNIADLISGITFIVLFQSGEASTVEGNKHINTHTHTYTHTHTHTHTNTQSVWSIIDNQHVCKCIWLYINATTLSSSTQRKITWPPEIGLLYAEDSIVFHIPNIWY